MVYKYFDKKSVLLADKSASRGAIKNEIIYDNKLAEELHKPIIRKFEKRKVHSPSIDNQDALEVGLATQALFLQLMKTLLYVEMHVWTGTCVANPTSGVFFS